MPVPREPARRRWTRLWAPDVERDVEDELRLHLELRARDFEREGASPEQAMQAARERFGQVDRIRAELRDHDRRRARQHERREAMSDLWRDLTHAARGLRRSPGFTLLAALTLALGIGATTAIFSVMYAALLRPLPYPGADRVVDLTEMRTGQRGTVSPPNFTDWREQSTTVAAMAAWHPSSSALTADGRSEQLQGAAVTADFFDVLGMRPLLGRTFAPAESATDGPPAVVIGEGLWRRRFGADPAILDGTIVLDGQATRVIGVMPSTFAYPASAELWRPLAFSADELATQRGAHYLRVTGRLRRGASLAAAQAELGAIGARLAARYPEKNGGATVNVRSLRDAVVGDVRPALYLLGGAVLLLLLLACANVANLLLARAVQRERERVIRVALGAARGRLVRQVLVESILLALIGGVSGLALACLGTRALTATLQVTRPALATARLEWPVLLFALGVSVVTGLVFGVLPALATSRVTRLEAVLRGTAPGAGGWRTGRRLRTALVTGQLAATVLLLTGAALLGRSFLALQQVDLGFRPNGVWSFSTSLPDARYKDPESASRFYAELLDRARAIPGVTDAGLTMGLPLSGMSYGISLYRLDGRLLPDEPDMPATQVRVVSDGYLETMRVRLLRGRTIEPGDRDGAPPVVVVSQKLAETLWPGEDPIGHTMELGTSFGLGRGRVGGTVVGVVADVRSDDVREPPLATTYLPHRQVPVGGMTLAARGADPVSLRRPLADAVAAIDPQIPLSEERTLDAMISDAVAEPRLYASLMIVFAMTALVLASVGVYGVIALAVSHRTHELGVRMALGAQRRAIVGLVLRQGIAPLAGGLAIGVVVAWWGSRALAGLLYGVSSTDPVTFTAVPVFLLLVALAATLVPARRATAIAPTEALRAD